MTVLFRFMGQARDRSRCSVSVCICVWVGSVALYMGFTNELNFCPARNSRGWILTAVGGQKIILRDFLTAGTDVL